MELKPLTPKDIRLLYTIKEPITTNAILVVSILCWLTAFAILFKVFYPHALFFYKPGPMQGLIMILCFLMALSGSLHVFWKKQEAKELHLDMYRGTKAVYKEGYTFLEKIKRMGRSRRTYETYYYEYKIRLKSGSIWYLSEHEYAALKSFDGIHLEYVHESEKRILVKGFSLNLAPKESPTVPEQPSNSSKENTTKNSRLTQEEILEIIRVTKADHKALIQMNAKDYYYGDGWVEYMLRERLGGDFDPKIHY